MLELYWGLLITGALFAVVSILFGDVIGHALDGVFDFLSGGGLEWLQPMVLFSGIATMGGAGILLTKYTGLGPLVVFLGSVIAAVAMALPVYFLYVKPMERGENSVAFSIQDLVGMIGEVSIPIPAKGTGEVLVRTGGGITNQLAESFDAVDIETGAKVVTVDVKEGVLLVSRLDSDGD